MFIAFQSITGCCVWRVGMSSMINIYLVIEKLRIAYIYNFEKKFGDEYKSLLIFRNYLDL